MYDQPITQPRMTAWLQERIEKLKEFRLRAGYEPAGRNPYYKTEAGGRAAVKGAVANCDLDFDLWQRMRNPATIGRFPLDLRQLWEFFAINDIKRVRPDGSVNHLSGGRSYEDAKELFGRAVLVSAMLPISDDVFRLYRQTIVEGGAGTNEDCAEAETEVAAILDEAMGRLAADLYHEKRAPLALGSEQLRFMSSEVIPRIHQGHAHGPCKEVHFPHKSLAVITGLAQFGVNRLTFRDELVDGEIERFIGPLSSMVVFDTHKPVRDGSGEIVLLTDEWYDHVTALSDFTQVDPEIDQQRFCTYIAHGESGERSCGLCLKYCPSGALPNSSPETDGEYREAVTEQAWRFCQENLQFDYATCREERAQKRNLYPGFYCGRCMAICGLLGLKREELFH